MYRLRSTTVRLGDHPDSNTTGSRVVDRYQTPTELQDLFVCLGILGINFALIAALVPGQGERHLKLSDFGDGTRCRQSPTERKLWRVGVRPLTGFIRRLLGGHFSPRSTWLSAPFPAHAGKSEAGCEHRRPTWPRGARQRPFLYKLLYNFAPISRKTPTSFEKPRKRKMA